MPTNASQPNDQPRSERLVLDMSKQPTETSCGPTCLHGVYRYYGDDIPLEQVISEVPELENGGGTLGVHLGLHALARGYIVRLYTYNLKVFDPTWMKLGKDDMLAKLAAQIPYRKSKKLVHVINSYGEFIRNGGEVVMEDLSPNLIRKCLSQGTPILTGLSSTYLYQHQREINETTKSDDVRGEPVGHFVVLSGYDKDERQAWIADPYGENPYNRVGRNYAVGLNRLVTSILLGVITYDANLLIIEPKK